MELKYILHIYILKEFFERRAELYIKGLFNDKYFLQKNRSLVKAVISIVSRQVSKTVQGKHIIEWLVHFFIPVFSPVVVVLET